MSTSKLQKEVSGLLSLYLPNREVKENYRPDWLITPEGNRLELDFYIEDLDFAIEVQGEQHFEFIPFFHGTIEKFEQRKRFDEFKRRICGDRQIILIEVIDADDCEDVLKTLREIIASSTDGAWTTVKQRQTWAMAEARYQIGQTALYREMMEARGVARHSRKCHQARITKGENKKKIKSTAKWMQQKCTTYHSLCHRYHDAVTNRFIELMNIKRWE